MKLPLFITLITLSFTGCSSDNEATGPDITGQWNWIISSGGIAGITETPESTGETRFLEITRDSLRSYRNGVLHYKTKYSLETQTSMLFNEPRPMLIHDNGFREIIELENDRLILTGDCNDCFISEYTRAE